MVCMRGVFVSLSLSLSVFVLCMFLLCALRSLSFVFHVSSVFLSCISSSTLFLYSQGHVCRVVRCLCMLYCLCHMYHCYLPLLRQNCLASFPLHLVPLHLVPLLLSLVVLLSYCPKDFKVYDVEALLILGMIFRCLAGPSCCLTCSVASQVAQSESIPNCELGSQFFGAAVCEKGPDQEFGTLKPQRLSNSSHNSETSPPIHNKLFDSRWWARQQRCWYSPSCLDTILDFLRLSSNWPDLLQTRILVTTISPLRCSPLPCDASMEHLWKELAPSWSR